MFTSINDALAGYDTGINATVYDGFPCARRVLTIEDLFAEVFARSVESTATVAELGDDSSTDDALDVAEICPRHPAFDNTREKALRHVMSKIVWDESDLAVFFDVTIDTVRHMKSRGEIPAVVQLNLRCWRVHRDAFLEHLKQRGMPKKDRGRPSRAGQAFE